MQEAYNQQHLKKNMRGAKGKFEIWKVQKGKN
jgi:hypothetical protein